MDVLGKVATTNSSVVRHKSKSFQHKLTDTMSSRQLLEVADRPTSVFIIFHKGWPLVVNGLAANIGSKHPGIVSLMRLQYSAVAPFLTESNLIFLGTTNSLNDAETFLTSVEHCDLLPENSIQSPVAYFCVDLSKLSAEEVTRLSNDSMNVEIIHPYSFLQMPSEDRKLFSRASSLLDWHRKNQFCPACGSGTSMVQGGYKRVCQNLSCLTHKGWILEIHFML